MKRKSLIALFCLLGVSCSEKKHYFYTTLYGYDTELSFYDFSGEKDGYFKINEPEDNIFSYTVCSFSYMEFYAFSYIEPKYYELVEECCRTVLKRVSSPDIKEFKINGISYAPDIKEYRPVFSLDDNETLNISIIYSENLQSNWHPLFTFEGLAPTRIYFDTNGETLGAYYYPSEEVAYYQIADSF